MTVLNCSIYHKFPNALVHKEGHHAKSAKTQSKALDMSKKHSLLQVRDWRKMIREFGVLLREADVHMNHRAESRIDCS